MDTTKYLFSPISFFGISFPLLPVPEALGGHESPGARMLKFLVDDIVTSQSRMLSRVAI